MPLPLRPPDYHPRVVVVGGNNPALLDTAELIDLSGPAPAWQSLLDMHHARGNCTAVLLPTGHVFVAGGLMAGPDEGPCEILDAESSAPSWQLGLAMTQQRGYHSAMILLADGSVLTGGDPGGPAGPTPHERFYPWYYDLPRPSITSAPGQANYGQAFTIDTPQGGDIAEVVLVRPGAVTHGFNMTQRAVECEITGQLQVPSIPSPNGRIAPPGWYPLFALSGLRVPSLGQWIRVTP